MRIIFVNYVWYNCERFEPRKESWCTNLEQTPLNRSQQLLALRAVKKFLNSRLKMNSRRFWNSQQRHKFLRAEASRDILKIRVLEMAFPEVFKRYF